jgi:hypothetical protein
MLAIFVCVVRFGWRTHKSEGGHGQHTNIVHQPKIFAFTFSPWVAGMCTVYGLSNACYIAAHNCEYTTYISHSANETQTPNTNTRNNIHIMISLMSEPKPKLTVCSTKHQVVGIVIINSYITRYVYVKVLDIESRKRKIKTFRFDGVVSNPTKIKTNV